MFKKYGFIPESRTRSKRLRLKSVTMESWLIVVDGSWQGSPTNKTFLTPVCNGIKRLGYVDCAASSMIRQPKNPLSF